MATRAPRSCAICGRAHSLRGSRCGQCQPQRPRTAEAHRATPPRKSAAKRGYGRKWRTARAAFLAEPDNRLCKLCQAAIATEVDHIEPHRGDLKLFWRRSNWQGACKRCHSRKSARGR